jgi:hypothetical protein
MREPIDRDVLLTNYQQTSILSAQKLIPKSGTKRRKIYDLIQESGVLGMCDHEIEEVTGWKHQTASSSRCGLVKDGWVIDSGMKRLTNDGNKAIVWIAC